MCDSSEAMEQAPQTQVTSPHIVVLDDDSKLRHLIGEFLAQHDMRVTGVASGTEARQVLARDPASILVLDVMMPGEDGLSVLRSLADKPGAPAIIMLSALGADTDRIVGLEMGADDYLAKPVNPRELLARVRAVLRRGTVSKGGEALTENGWRFDPASFTVTAPGGEPVELTTGEFRLAHALASRAGRIVSRETLLEALHGEDGEAFDRAVDVAISRLRAKLAAHGGTALIRTIRGEGYMFARSA